MTYILLKETDKRGADNKQPKTGRLRQLISYKIHILHTYIKTSFSFEKSFLRETSSDKLLNSTLKVRFS